jgi:hypothetical protein
MQVPRRAGASFERLMTSAHFLRARRDAIAPPGYTICRLFGRAFVL